MRSSDGTGQAGVVRLRLYMTLLHTYIYIYIHKYIHTYIMGPPPEVDGGPTGGMHYVRIDFGVRSM